MIYDANTTHWPVGSLVIHDCDAKKAEMLMRVTGYDRANGLVRTRYVHPGHLSRRMRGVFKNELRFLHNPRRFQIPLPADVSTAESEVARG